MTEYKVGWVIDVDAPDPRAAIRRALGHMTAADTTATVFEVAETGSKHRPMTIDLDDEDDPTGQPVWDREGKQFGIATGATRKCQMESCPSRRIVTRWPSGRITMPCARGMDFRADGYHIL